MSLIVSYVSGHFDFEGDELHIRFRSDESTKRSGFVISGQQIPCEERPVQAPLSQSLPGTSDNQTLSTDQQKSFQTPTSTSLSGNQSDNVNFILTLLNRRPTPTERREGPEGRNISEEDFTELDPGLVTFREPDDDHTNADQNIPGSPDFNPFTGAGLPPTLPTLPTDIPTFPTNVPTIPTNFPTNPTTFPTIPTDFPTTTVDFPATTFPSTRLECNQLITSLTAEITSPNYPSNYPVSVDCEYTIGRGALDVCRVSKKSHCK